MSDTVHPGFPLPADMEANIVDLARRQFVEAETVEAYLAARDLAVRAARSARLGGRAEPLAQALVTAAECSWFAANLPQAEDEPSPDDLLRDCLFDTAAVGTVVTPDTEVAWLATWASLASGLLDAVGRWPTLVDPAAPERMAALALVTALGEAIPPDPVFSTMRGGPRQAVRLAVGMVTVWVATGEPVPAWLRDRVAASLSAPRTPTRSRLARLVESAWADEVAGHVLTDALEVAWPDTADAAGVHTLADAAAARTLLDGIAAAPVVTDDAGAAGLEREATAYDPPSDTDLVARQLQLVSALPLGGTPQERERRLTLVAGLEQRYAELGAGYTEVGSLAPLEAVQAVLEPQQVLVEYVLPFRETHPAYLPHVLVVTSDDVALVPVPEPEGVAGFIGVLAVDGHAPLDSSPLGDAVHGARVALERGTEPAALAHHLSTLYDALIAPVLATGLTEGREEWVVVPSRALHLVPWMALHDQTGRWLLDDAAVTIAPSASVWMHLQGRGSRTAGHLVSLGDPLVTHLGLAALPGTADEVTSLAAAWGAAGLTSTAVTGIEARWSTLEGGAAGAGLVHIATHGSFPDEAALFDQGFQLSPGPGHQGRVVADDLRGLPLGDAWCVLLALCNGGAYRVGRGNEPYGLVPALLEAGATTVVAPQWAVDDRDASALVADLAPALLPLGPSAALRQAVLRQREAHVGVPGDYCAFVAVGTGLGPVGSSLRGATGGDRR